ncbi:MAG: hypothetical protein LBB98_06470 [Treponema sp.]|nr:hypothetical protein [Treponema sp.]
MIRRWTNYYRTVVPKRHMPLLPERIHIDRKTITYGC